MKHPVVALFCVTVGIFFAVSATSSVEATQLDKSLPVFLRFADGQGLYGELTAFDEHGLVLVDDEAREHKRKWSDVRPRTRSVRLYEHLVAEDDGEAWLRFAVALRDQEGGDEIVQAALDRAVRADKSTVAKTDLVRQGKSIDEILNRADQDRKLGQHDGPVGPKQIGPVQHKYWGKLDPQTMQESTEASRAFAQATESTMNIALQEYETKYFLFYSDLERKEAAKWASLLDKMYGKLAKMFGLSDDENIFRGKCPIFVFRKAKDYHRFQALMHQTDSRGSAGMCHSYGNGFVHVAFYRQPQDTAFAHVLVHESVHGFLHRFRSPVSVPSWANEGLAEYIAATLVKKSKEDEKFEHWSRQELQRRKSLGGNFFTARQISGWQYGVAKMLCELMIAQPGRRYANFIEAGKDGKPWIKALEEDFGMDMPSLVEAFGKYKVNIPDLRP